MNVDANGLRSAAAELRKHAANLAASAATPPQPAFQTAIAAARVALMYGDAAALEAAAEHYEQLVVDWMADPLGRFRFRGTCTGADAADFLDSAIRYSQAASAAVHATIGAGA